MNKLIPFGKSSEILVCETDGFYLSAAVLKRSGEQLTLMHSAKAQTADMAEALDDVIKQLRNSGWEGHKAILLSPAVMTSLVELPVKPKKPRPLPQMMEMVRWEVEPLLTQYASRWTIGEMMIARGYMASDQVHAVIDLQQGKANDAGGLALTDQFVQRRFGDLAQELGFARSSQLNVCAEAQKWLRAVDDEVIECGWAPQDEVDDVPGMYHWLVSCVHHSLLQQWTNEFHKHGIQLQAMYPLRGNSAALVKQDMTAIVIETQQKEAFLRYMKDGQVVSQHSHLAQDADGLAACLETYHLLNPASSEPVWLASWQEDEQFADALNAALDIKVNELLLAPIGGTVSVGMLGTAYHAFALNDADQQCVEVRLGGPLPPLMQRLEVRLAIMMLALIVVMLGSEVSLWWRMTHAEIAKQEIDSQWQLINEASKRVNSQNKQIEERKKLLAEQKQDQSRLDALLTFYSEDIPERVALVKAILGVLQTAVPEDVIIQKIDELGKRVPMREPATKGNTTTTPQMVEVENFNLEAWALTETSAQSFIQIMEKQLEPWGMTVRDTLVRSDMGPLNLDGFTVAMRLVRLAEQDVANTVGKK